MTKIIIIPVLDDNYAYLIIDEKKNVAAVVDGVEPMKILAVAEREKVKITHLLTTHSHWDHSGGNIELQKIIQNKTNEVPIIIGGRNDSVPGVNIEVDENDIIYIGDIIINILYTPCHTRGHVLYYLKSENDKENALFTGDTLFIAGCGRFNNGTAEEMYDALINKIKKLHLSTKIYCGHEYTLNNLRFANYIEPNHIEINNKLNIIMKEKSIHKDKKFCTVPSTIKEELQTNPFLRINIREVQKKVMYENQHIDFPINEKKKQIMVLKYLREMKNAFGLGTSMKQV